MNKALLAFMILALLAGCYAGIAYWKKIWPFKKTSTVMTLNSFGQSCSTAAICSPGPDGSALQPPVCHAGKCSFALGKSNSARPGGRDSGFCESTSKCDLHHVCVASTVSGVKTDNGTKIGDGQCYPQTTLTHGDPDAMLMTCQS